MIMTAAHEHGDPRYRRRSSPWPNNGAIVDLARQGGIAGDAHIADVPVDLPKEKTSSTKLPATVAHGKVDDLEVDGVLIHQHHRGIWYRLLNLGFACPRAGTDATANHGSLRGPIGLVRVSRHER